ncbi:MAG: hypothetical protein AAFQ23_04195 [Cyanobacteria bacterium J06623_1]
MLTLNYDSVGAVLIKAIAVPIFHQAAQDNLSLAAITKVISI